MLKDVLIITSYFPPEIGAASNRIFHLATGLEQRGFEVQILTPLPNYPTGEIFKDYKGKFKQTSIENNIKIHRLWLYATVSKNKFLRLIAMISYSISLLWFFIFNKIPKTVIVQSPPLLVAFTSMFFLRSKTRKLILNVSDLWPIAGLELGAFKKNFSYKMLEKIERFNYRNAAVILGQSEEILTHILNLFPKKEHLLYRNYPDFIAPKLEARNPRDKNLKLVYAGLLGVAQGVYKLCTALEYNNIELHIYGSGAEQKLIEDFIENNADLPVYFHGSVSREALHNILLQYDIAIIPLRNRIYGSVPSKLFEYAKLGLPILYFGGGEGENIVIDNKLGWVAKAADYQALNSVIASIKTSELTLAFKQNIKQTATSVFNIEKQLEEVSRKLH